MPTNHSATIFAARWSMLWWLKVLRSMVEALGVAGIIRKYVFIRRHNGGNLHMTLITTLSKMRFITVAAAGGKSGKSRAARGGGT